MRSQNSNEELTAVGYMRKNVVGILAFVVFIGVMAYMCMPRSYTRVELVDVPEYTVISEDAKLKIEDFVLKYSIPNFLNALISTDKIRKVSLLDEDVLEAIILLSSKSGVEHYSDRYMGRVKLGYDEPNMLLGADLKNLESITVVDGRLYASTKDGFGDWVYATDSKVFNHIEWRSKSASISKALRDKASKDSALYLIGEDTYYKDSKGVPHVCIATIDKDKALNVSVDGKSCRAMYYDTTTAYIEKSTDYKALISLLTSYTKITKEEYTSLMDGGTSNE